jgi:hypothetical protein
VDDHRTRDMHIHRCAPLPVGLDADDADSRCAADGVVDAASVHGEGRRVAAHAAREPDLVDHPVRRRVYDDETIGKPRRVRAG